MIVIVFAEKRPLPKRVSLSLMLFVIYARIVGKLIASTMMSMNESIDESGEWVNWVTGKLLPLEDIVYSLTVHDLLSAFSEWSDE